MSVVDYKNAFTKGLVIGKTQRDSYKIYKIDALDVETGRARITRLEPSAVSKLLLETIREASKLPTDSSAIQLLNEVYLEFAHFKPDFEYDDMEYYWVGLDWFDDAYITNSQYNAMKGNK